MAILDPMIFLTFWADKNMRPFVSKKEVASVFIHQALTLFESLNNAYQNVHMIDKAILFVGPEFSEKEKC